MVTSSVNPLSAFAPSGTQQTDSGSQLLQEDFLRLMIAQFQQQDPFNPTDHGEFLGQMAQFSTVAGIGELTNAFEGLATSLSSNNILQASTLVGRTVLSASDTAQLREGDDVEGRIELPAAAEAVVVEITDSAGSLVRSLDLGAHGAGRVDFTWDGLDAEGEPVPAGEYGIGARISSQGTAYAQQVLVAEKVESVTLGTLGSDLEIYLEGGRSLAMGQIRAIM